MPFKYREIEKRLSKLNYRIVRQRGSHVIFTDGQNTFSVPNHGSRDISLGVEKRLLKMLGLSADEFRNVK